MNAVPLDKLPLDNRFARELPDDPNSVNSRRQVTHACYSRVEPTPVSGPRLVAYSPEVAEILGLDMGRSNPDQFARVFSGTELLPGMDPMAMCYGGHQFGNWAGQLGDGRAINLCEVVTADQQHWTLQLKGAGPTPYSRMADGLAVLRSSVREFLCSEAMFHLGVPTTRALSLVLTGEHVLRDMFYDGNPAREQGAVVCRVARSFVRFGNFEIFASRGDVQTLRKLTDFTIRNDFAHLVAPSSGEIPKSIYSQFFAEVCQLTAEMIVHWMRVGFVHGVMNTDNMSILGLTIDYGPYGWLEDYDPDWTPNTTDATHHRYRFGSQPEIAHWNLTQLARALYPLIEDAQPLHDALNLYASVFQSRWQAMMATKLGWNTWENETDDELVKSLFELLTLKETDMTLFFRGLANVPTTPDATDEQLLASIAEAYYEPSVIDDDDYRQAFLAWMRRYQSRIHQDGTRDSIRLEKMNQVNPKYVLRNYLAQLAIDQADEGDFSLIEELMDVLRHPYDEQPGKESFAEKRPEWARHRPGCSMLSCSS